MISSLIIDSVMVGQSQPLARGKSSAIAKSPVHHPVWIGELGLEGDTQVDTQHHGGPEKAVHIYPMDHYATWITELSSQTARELLQKPGAFGENLSVRGLTEHDVCLGDIWRAGSALLQISQGRQPCWKLNERFQTSDMARRVQDSGRTGWYFRVIESGHVEAGSNFVLEQRLHPDWSIARISHVFYHDQLNRHALEALSQLSELAESWKNLVKHRLATRRVEDWERRLGEE